MSERNQLGQYATPADLAFEIVRATKWLVSRKKLRFLEPAIGTGSFYSALLSVFGRARIAEAVGIEIDEEFVKASKALWTNLGLDVTLGDFTEIDPPKQAADKANLLICNPPYVRHHHINATQKARLRQRIEHLYGAPISGLAGLYCYFMLLGHQWLAEDGVAAWLVPTEFMEVNYGASVRRWMAESTRVVRVHRFDPKSVMFNDALVTSCVVWLQKCKPAKHGKVRFTFGQSIESPEVETLVDQEELVGSGKWTSYFDENRTSDVEGGPTLADYFEVRRGIATGSNSFFVLPLEKAKALRLPSNVLTPILPGPRILKATRIEADPHGHPSIDQPLVLLDVNQSPELVKQESPTVWSYLQTGVQAGVPEGYLCRNRKLWYLQERRDPAPIVCTYMGRQRGSNEAIPFRFILNESKAVATNVYLLLYPRGRLAAAAKMSPSVLFCVWQALQRLDGRLLMRAGRVYGGGLHKMEPSELLSINATFIEKCIQDALGGLAIKTEEHKTGTRELFPVT
ncbi:MAG: hypothetical protein BroJett014_04050 [Planctomycetota bacterium]|nr:SAM-dependent DNA methyltransferase [Planctomycetota bacterium]GIK51432.1 MAG: hypothetical protein BroJett014_04050 [Planctomycetota bacterium]